MHLFILAVVLFHICIGRGFIPDTKHMKSLKAVLRKDPRTFKFSSKFVVFHKTDPKLPRFWCSKGLRQL